MRGNIIPYNPFFFAYLAWDRDNNRIHLFIDQKDVKEGIRAHLDLNNVAVHDYTDIFDFVKNLEGSLWMGKSANYALSTARADINFFATRL